MAEPVALPSFAVRDTRVGAYGAAEANSTTRISLPVQDTAQSLTIVTRELIDDTQGMRMLDVAKFATPILESTASAGDVYSIRGFRTLMRFIDGVNVGPLANSMWSDQTNVERLEIIKGPNAILMPGGGNGGVMNQITKSPKFETFTRLTLRARSYLGSEASLDANRVFAGGESAARLVLTRWDGRGYFDGQVRRGWLLAPSFTRRFRDGAELVLKLETLENEESSSMGVAIDPAVGTRTGGYARKHPLLPRDNQWPQNDRRTRRETRLTAELRFDLAGRVASRLWLMADDVFFVTPVVGGAVYDANRDGVATASDQQGDCHPLTGEWEPFRSFAYDSATGAVTITQRLPSSSTQFTRLQRQLLEQRYEELHLKNDYALDYRLGPRLAAKTVGGISANWQRKVGTKNYQVSRPPVDVASGRPVGAEQPRTQVLTRDKLAEQRDVQAFLFQRFEAWEGRGLFSAGVARYHGVLTRRDHSELPPTLLRSTRNSVTDLNAGAIFKPVAAVSVFAGYNRIGGALPSSTTAGEFTSGSFKVGVGEQRELGVKTAWLKNRVRISAAWFEVEQRNASVTNGAFFTNPLTEPPFLYFDFGNRGWELEFSALLTAELEVVGNLTRMRMREIHGGEQAMVPDRAGAFFGKYTFRTGRLKGFGLSFGADYTDRTPGETPDARPGYFTAAGVLKRPSFYLAPRTLLLAGASYQRERWSAALTVNNLANKDYIQSAAGGRNTLLPGEPRNFSLTVELRL